MVVGHGQQDGGEGGLPSAGHGSGEDVEQRDGSDAEEEGWQTEDPVGLAERQHADVRGDGIERVLVVAGEDLHHGAKGHAIGPEQREDLVDP